MWKKRIENQIKDLCKDLDRMIELSKENKLKKKHYDQLQKKYFLNLKGLCTSKIELSETMKECSIKN